MIAWAAPDEVSPKADAVMRQVMVTGVVVPSLLFLEIANILVTNERKNRLTSEEVAGIVLDLGELALVIDHETASLARQHRLTVYYAAYLELAKRRGLPLATRDRELLASARAEGLAVEFEPI